MKYITFFSTKLLYEGNLFYKGDEPSSNKEENYPSPVLNEYFEKFVPKNFIPEFNETNWWDLYKDPKYDFKDEDFLKLIKEHLPASSETSFEDIQDELENYIRKATADQIKDFTEGFYQLDPVIPQCLNILRDKILAKEKREYYSKIDALSKVYSLAKIIDGEDQYYAYAVYVLGRDTQDNEEGKRGWIKTIIEALKKIPDANEEVSIQLVLHDKDLGGEFLTKDVYVLEKEQIQKLTDEKLCKIVFFKHTSNGIVDLLSKPDKSSKDVYDIVKELMEKYSQMKDKVREIDQLPYTEDGSWECYQITQGIKELTDLNSQNKA